MRHRKIFARVTATVLVSAFAAAALAHGGATGIVKERMDGMSAMAKAMKALAPMMKGEAVYDPATVAAGAGTIASHAGREITSKFPQGSGGMPSEAAEEIWTDWEAFVTLALELETAALALELASGREAGAGASATTAEAGIPEPVRSLADMSTRQLFGRVGKTCSGCHKQYRVETE